MKTGTAFVGLMFVSGLAAGAIPQTERDALIALYNATDGANWTNRTNWRNVGDTDFNDPGTENTWFGVTCDAGNTMVTELDLSGNNLTGSIPTELEDLSNMQVLFLHTNQLSGSIPSQLGSLMNLEYLYLLYNNLTGSIPSELGNLSNLEYLSLGFNNLTGNIPTELGSLPILLGLGLYSNQLTGNIPTELGSLLTLEWLRLESNQLSGNIPTELGNLSSLFMLRLESNQLNGKIPTQLGGLSALETLRLSGNQLCGNIPTSLASLPNLVSTDIGYNALWTDDPTLQAFLNAEDPDWDQTQTIAPADIAAGSETSSSFVVSWTPILYIADDGWYEIAIPGEIFSDGFETGDTTLWGAPAPTSPGYFMTVDKTDNSILVDGLQPGTEYQFVVRTVTEPHASNQNQVISDESAVVLVTTTP